MCTASSGIGSTLHLKAAAAQEGSSLDFFFAPGPVLQDGAKRRSAPDSVSHGTLLRSISPPPKAAHNDLTLSSALAQRPVVTGFSLPKAPHLAADHVHSE